jgi:hypothetical protein
MSLAQEIRDRLASKSKFSLAEVHRWMADESSLELWAIVYDVLGGGFYQIKPEPDMDETCRFMTIYLLRCIHENIGDYVGPIPTRYEAASILANCLKHWASKLPEMEPVMLESARGITEAFLVASTQEQDCLITGTLEHALESAKVRPFFKHWQYAPTLHEPWNLAMEWALAHSDSSDGL